MGGRASTPSPRTGTCIPESVQVTRRRILHSRATFLLLATRTFLSSSVVFSCRAQGEELQLPPKASPVHSDHSRMVQAAWFHHIHQVENFVVAWAQSGQDASSKFLASLQQRVAQVCSEQPTLRELLQSSIERFLSISGQNHAIMAASNWTYFSSCNSSKHTQDV